jgi:hypothetical protein
MERTNSSGCSSRLPRSSPKVLFSFLEPEPARGMVEEPVSSDTRLSLVQLGEMRIQAEGYTYMKLMIKGLDLIGTKEP